MRWFFCCCCCFFVFWGSAFMRDLEVKGKCKHTHFYILQVYSFSYIFGLNFLQVSFTWCIHDVFLAAMAPFLSALRSDTKSMWPSVTPNQWMITKRYWLSCCCDPKIPKLCYQVEGWKLTRTLCCHKLSLWQHKVLVFFSSKHALVLPWEAFQNYSWIRL